MMSAEALREVVREALLELDERTHARLVRSIVARVLRTGTGWTPAAISDGQIAKALAFVTAAERVGYADPSKVDEVLELASSAFLRKDYATANRIFGVILPLIGDGSIDLGQDEMASEVLGVDIDECATQYVVSAYVIASSSERAEAVRAAISTADGVGTFLEPLRKMERVAVEPLPDLADFLPRWRSLVAREVAGKRSDDWDTDGDRWLREVVQRLEGADGLAKIARSTRRAADLRAWCQSLVDAARWQAALPAFQEAADVFPENDFTRGEFSDGAALAAQQLGRKDLPAHFERAWRGCPSLPRLLRWLGSSTTKRTFEKRIAEALHAIPTRATRQRALLHVLAGDIAQAATLLANAPGIGWSDDEHPGHLLFPLFVRLLGANKVPAIPALDLALHRGTALEELGRLSTAAESPRLVTPTVGALFELADIGRISDTTTRGTVLAAMKNAAENRVAGVTEQKRRQQYGHAAELVGDCVACDSGGKTALWAAKLRAEYKRFPALREQFDRVLTMG